MTTALFESRAKEGAVAEAMVRDAFMNAGWRVQWRMYRNRKDLEVGSPYGTEFIEVKNEDYYLRSGNLCVETRQGLGLTKKPAGCMDSESTICAHKFGDEWLLYRRVRMVQKILDNTASGAWKVVDFRGADNGNGGIVIPRLELLTNQWVIQTTLENMPLCRLFATSV